MWYLLPCRESSILGSLKYWAGDALEGLNGIRCRRIPYPFTPSAVASREASLVALNPADALGPLIRADEGTTSSAFSIGPIQSLQAIK